MTRIRYALACLIPFIDGDAPGRAYTKQERIMSQFRAKRTVVNGLLWRVADIPGLDAHVSILTGRVLVFRRK